MGCTGGRRYAFDLDVSAFLCAANGKCRRDKDFVFYNNLDHPSGSVIHMGDNRTGDGDGDDEQVKVILSKVPADIEKIVFTITIDDAERRGQNFGMVRNAYCRVVDENDGAELTRYNLNEEASIETAVVMAGCIVMMANGSSTQSVTDTRAAWLGCADVTASM